MATRLPLSPAPYEDISTAQAADDLTYYYEPSHHSYPVTPLHSTPVLAVPTISLGDMGYYDSPAQFPAYTLGIESAGEASFEQYLQNGSSGRGGPDGAWEGQPSY